MARVFFLFINIYMQKIHVVDLIGLLIMADMNYQMIILYTRFLHLDPEFIVSTFLAYTTTCMHLWFIPGKPEVASFNVFVPTGENRCYQHFSRLALCQRFIKE
jgi:hypothetical protein